MDQQVLINYENYVKPYEYTFTKIAVSFEITEKIKNFTNQLIIAKQKETQYQLDHNKEFKRFYTGFLGEAAVEIALGISFIDWTVGHSKNYNVPDIAQLNTGVKTVEYGKFPVINKVSTYPQIINFKISDNEILMAGLALPQILNTYQTDNLILDPNLKAKGTKTCFYGFEHLKKLKISRK